MLNLLNFCSLPGILPCGKCPAQMFFGAWCTAFDRILDYVFSPGFTHGSLSPFDASILQEFTPIGRGFVTLRGGFWTLQKKEERERESIQQDPVDWQSIDFLLTLFHAFFYILRIARIFFLA